MMKKRIAAAVGGLVIALGLAAGPASAATIQVALDGVIQNADGTYNWTYSVNLTRDSRIDGSEITNPNPASFVIYDFRGLLPGAEGYANAGDNPFWLYTSQNVGPIPFVQTPTDDPTLLNAAFRYDAENGPTVDNFDGESAILVGYFTLRSIYGNQTFVTGNYSSEDSRELNALGSVGPGGHTAPVTTPGAIPEPASLLLLGSGLLGVVARLRRRS